MRIGADRAPEVLCLGAGADGLVLDGVPTTVLPLAAREALVAHLGDDVPAKAGDTAELPYPLEVPARVVVVGLGDGGSRDVRRAGAAAARKLKAEDCAVAIPGLDDDVTAALVEGLLLGAYKFDSLVDRAIDVLGDVDADALERGLTAGYAALWARDLTNRPAATKTPTWLGQQAVDELSPLGVRVTVRDEAWLAAHRFGGVLAVGGGAGTPPRLIEASWRPRGAPAGHHVVLVGKGITFDTGGLNIKPGDSMRSMYTDMAGGAAALAALRIVAARKLPLRVTVLVPAAENAVSGSAYRPSDVIRHVNGRTSEIDNTDAEGRLVLADALAYAVAALKPTVLVDVATLTGAMKVALGLRTGGMFATTDELAAALIAAGEEADEPLWRMPLLQEYESVLESPVADATNSAAPGGIAAALFLKPFTGDVPWAHLDIAGPARSSAEAGLFPKGATGYGARLLAAWLESLARA